MDVLVANQGKAALFKGKKDLSNLKLNKSFENEDFLKKDSSLFTHRAGNGFTSYTSDKVTLGENKYKEELVSKFSDEISSYIHDLAKGGAENSLIVIAEPSFLGEFRKKIDPELVKEEVPKNFYTVKPHGLDQYLEKLEL